MIFPKGKMMYENLNTSFTNFGELLLNLNATSFTGYVHVSFLEYEGVLLVDSGKVVNAFEEIGETRATGQKAVASILSHAKDRDGTISVYHLSTEMVTMLASMMKGEVVYKKLTTELTSLDKLIDKLKNEEHTGYIEITMNKEKGTGIIFLQSGDAIESIVSTNGETISGPQVLNRMIETSSATGATFNVYKADPKGIFEDSVEIMAGFELPQLLAVWQDILGAVERATHGLYDEGHFLDVFKDTLIERAADYPFLDPFAAEFEYKNGKIFFHGELVNNFSHGLGECLNATIDTLATENRDANLAAKIKTEVQAVKKKHAQVIEKFNLEATMGKYLTS